jgi:hypothetical protein
MVALQQGKNMKKPELAAIKDRFEGIAANVLEDMIHEVEEKNHLKVKDLEVLLIPDQGVCGTPPAVEVTLTVESPGSGTGPDLGVLGALLRRGNAKPTDPH